MENVTYPNVAVRTVLGIAQMHQIWWIYLQEQEAKDSRDLCTE